jgi:hypothetical protein
MDLAFDLLQGAGIAAAIGIRPLLPVLLVGALASADTGLDFDGTDFAFLEGPGFLLAVVVLVALSDIARRRFGEEAFDAGPGIVALAVLVVGLGALEAAGSMADRDHPVAAGVATGAVAAVLGLLASRSLFRRVRSRLDAATAQYLSIYREGIAVAAAGLSVLFPPLAVLVIAALAWLLLGGRRREGEKYAGLRILR